MNFIITNKHFLIYLFRRCQFPFVTYLLNKCIPGCPFLGYRLSLGFDNMNICQFKWVVFEYLQYMFTNLPHSNNTNNSNWKEPRACLYSLKLMIHQFQHVKQDCEKESQGDNFENF